MEKVRVRIECKQQKCKAQPLFWEGDVYPYQVGLLAVWHHSSHEGHRFNYWENGELILDCEEALKSS